MASLLSSQRDIHKAMPQEARREELPSELTQEDEVGRIQLKESSAFNDFKI